MNEKQIKKYTFVLYAPLNSGHKILGKINELDFPIDIDKYCEEKVW